ncbi:ATP-dependent RNA helicase SUPV3L1, mitochondrial-like isoform X1 [Clavelina lepadiformis]|uniref:ATP-dependent RNA helicase SUPV3L1, mitochondrial-like isoform X1 n=2 Tax=Clavelina lepadiformis TaxID=159417 RepID=UPI0040428229
MVAHVLPGLIQFMFPNVLHILRRNVHVVKSINTHQYEVSYKIMRQSSTSQSLCKEKRTSVGSYISTPVPPSVANHIFHSFEHSKKIQKEMSIHGIPRALSRTTLKKLKEASKKPGSTLLSMKVHHILRKISRKEYDLSALLPLFVDHTLILHPNTKKIKKMKEISDLSDPIMWYPEARSMFRKVIFHAGPTNSGKTHAALQRFYEADSGVYCGPLRLLAREVCQKSRDKGVSCDMITGDDQDYHFGKHSRAEKVSCTVEMTNINKIYDVAIIDEIQMVSDIERGWAWTRAFLGVCADEIHVCGEERAIKVVRKLVDECGDCLSVEKYKRLGQLRVKKNPVISLDKLTSGDCVVCFNKDEIYKYKRLLEDASTEVAMIYGSLPPHTKIEQAKKFNDPDNKCNILVTTDAIGMGLNLNIKRIIFNDVRKTTLVKGGERVKAPLTPYHALQIAGRAGRFGSQYPDGAVTTMKAEHINTLHRLLRTKVPDIETAGLHPSFDKIKQFANVMRTTSLYDVLTSFISLCGTDNSLYFLCSLEECRDIAKALQNVKLPLNDMYTFCLSPVSIKRGFVVGVLGEFAKMHSKGKQISAGDLKLLLNWPPRQAREKQGMLILEDTHECIRLYLWLSFRFPGTFVDNREVKYMSKTVDKVTSRSVSSKADKAPVSSNQEAWEDLKEFLVDDL